MGLLERLKSSLPELPPTEERGWRRLRFYLRSVLTFQGPPRWIALSFAVGFFISMNPFYGTHTLSLFLLIPLLRLHPLATLIGSLGNPPWVAAVFYPFAFGVGRLLLSGFGLTALELPQEFSFAVLKEILSSTEGILGLFLPLLVGTSVLGFLGAVVAFLIVLRALQRIRGEEAGSPVMKPRTMESE